MFSWVVAYANHSTVASGEKQNSLRRLSVFFRNSPPLTGTICLTAQKADGSSNRLLILYRLTLHPWFLEQ